MKKVLDEISLVLGTLAGIGEAIVLMFPTGPVHDVLVIALPIISAALIRSKVTPVSKLASRKPAAPAQPPTV